MTTISIITRDAAWQFVVEHVGTFNDDKQALEWVNQQAQIWAQAHIITAKALDLTFEITTEVKMINGLPEFRWLRYTPYIEANWGDAVWMAVLDRTSQQRIYGETQAEFEASLLPEGVTVVGLNDPATLHNTIKDAVGE